MCGEGRDVSKVGVLVKVHTVPSGVNVSCIGVGFGKGID